MKNLLEAQLVAKEEIAKMVFPKDEILQDEMAISERNILVQKAAALGNLEKHKVKIYFQDSEGLKKVITTIWALGEKNVIFKSGMSIPINRIENIDFLSE